VWLVLVLVDVGGLGFYVVGCGGYSVVFELFYYHVDYEFGDDFYHLFVRIRIRDM